MSPATVREAPGHPVCETAVLEVSFPPFATLVTEKTTLAEKFWNSLKPIQVRNQRRASVVVGLLISSRIFGRRIVSCDSMPMCIVAGNQCDQ